jgi:protocatechuate 3,4-dioxygenase beta subunit
MIIMTSDDIRPGRVLTRREVLALAGFSGAAVLTGRAAAQSTVPACVVRPEQTEGPFFVNERLQRSDIRVEPATGEQSPGVVLALAFNVSRLRTGGCAPLAGATVDVWHCDAFGAYSDARNPGADTVGRKFLRGYQATDATGTARFTTIYPGRAVHIHFKIRTAQGQEFTSQIYFDDALTDRVHAQPPYAARGLRRLRNEADGLYRHGGRQLTVTPAPSGPGYATTFAIALSP